MFSTTTILICLVIAAISGGSGFYISTKFNSSNHARTDKSGDFGTPRGSFIALMSGLIIGMTLTSALSHYIPGDWVGPAFITATIVGGIAGMIPLFVNSKPKN